jgi:putative membrane protein
MALLTPEEQKRVEAAVAAAESRSSGEVVVAVVDRSDAWAGPRAATAVVLSAGLGLALLHGLGGRWPDLVLLGVVPLWGFFYAALGLAPLLRLVLPAHLAEAAAQRRARVLFAEHGLHATREHTGVLVLVSELERRVVVLGDSGVDAHVRAEGWRDIVDELVRHLKTGRPADGLVAAVERVGAVLAAHFPRRPDDRNELPDQVIDER